MRKYGTMLVVDDEHEVGEILVDVFKNTFEKVIYCDNVQEALGVVKATPLSLILSDFNMQGMSGSDFVIKLRANGDLTPVIFLTGYASKELVITALRLGVADVQEKPFSSEKLIECVDRVLEIEKRKAQLYQAENSKMGQKKKMVGLLQVVNGSKKSS